MRKGKFCPKCGKETDVLHDGLCGDCFTGRLDLREDLPVKVVLGTCKMCRNVFHGEKKFSSEETALDDFLRRALGRDTVIDATYRIVGNTMHATINVSSDGVEKRLEKSVPIVRKSITCKFCNLQKANYYNVTLQVRVPKGMEDAILQEIEEMLAAIRKRDNYSFISGVEKLKEGTDLYIGSKSAVEKVANYLKGKYGAKTKISRKLYGLVEGKKSYRDTVLVSIGD